MQWSEVRKLYPEQWVLLEELKSYEDNNEVYVENKWIDIFCQNDCYIDFGLLDEHSDINGLIGLDIRSGEPYELANVFEAEDTLHSERIPCVSFVVKEGLKIG
ncbi:hypothetical protein [Effusibacillus lacus]|uniref:Uncharacterized protein n=1 Tax=Effusibacillus lacus TaxID=1348429 RepID=A0A292YMG1_9BACL|nr:hypothetical protein [Effusibacillus lacus]TCS69493.1 hypothetical protein EDD64_1369 [Effusibacillus lacus]GAX90091.1 hypothetical protein EFBL_1717 [Effusibacillus lacus]